jgi:hypothetical protein
MIDFHYHGVMAINGNFMSLDTHGHDRMDFDETPYPQLIL